MIDEFDDISQKISEERHTFEGLKCLQMWTIKVGSYLLKCYSTDKAGLILKSITLEVRALHFDVFISTLPVLLYKP